MSVVGRVVFWMWGELSSEWGELSSECGASCLGASCLWGELSWGELSLGRVVRNPYEITRCYLCPCVQHFCDLFSDEINTIEVHLILTITGGSTCVQAFGISAIIYAHGQVGNISLLIYCRSFGLKKIN